MINKTVNKKLKFEQSMNEMLSDFIPSMCDDRYWIRVKNLKNPKDETSRVGKWLLFVPLENLDKAWGLIRQATLIGMLGNGSKTGTVKANPNRPDGNDRVICVYTYDYSDAVDVFRVRKVLRILGFSGRIPYKTNDSTVSGLYATTGNTHVSLYYE